MRSSCARALSVVGFSFLIALTAACGGSHAEAKAPPADAPEAPRVGSTTPDPPSESPGETPKAPVASADNGSDIIPPFSAGKEPAKKATPGKAARKAPGKPKKKATRAASRGAT